jgi:hypothetical protein
VSKSVNGYYGPNSKIWNDTDCRNIGISNQSTVTGCQNYCNNTAGCSAINYNPLQGDSRFGDCIARGCPSGKAPSWNYPPYTGYSKYSLT